MNAKSVGATIVLPLHTGLGPLWSQSGPTLQISSAVTATADHLMTVPIDYFKNGAAVTSLAFSLDIDQTCLAFDPSDDDDDGLPDALTVHLPVGMNASVAVDLQDADGELDLIIADFFPPFVSLPDRSPLLEMRLRTICQVAPGATQQAALRFSTNPAPSLGTASGAPIVGNTIDGWVTLIGPPLPPMATPTPTLIPTLIPTQPPVTPTFVPTTAPPTTVVAYFIAMAQTPSIRLQWQTTQEVETTGFYIYRRHVEDSTDFVLLSPLLPAQGAPGVYHFIDQRVQLDDRYLYLLVEEKTTGVHTEFIELMTTGSLASQQRYRLLLPLIVR